MEIYFQNPNRQSINQRYRPSLFRCRRGRSEPCQKTANNGTWDDRWIIPLFASDTISSKFFYGQQRDNAARLTNFLFLQRTSDGGLRNVHDACLLQRDAYLRCRDTTQSFGEFTRGFATGRIRFPWTSSFSGRMTQASCRVETLPYVKSPAFGTAKNCPNLLPGFILSSEIMHTSCCIRINIFTGRNGKNRGVGW